MTAPRDLLATAHVLADVSAKAILPKFRKPIAVEDKGGRYGFDPVTAADKAAERVMRKALAERHPEHAIVGEEFGTTAGSAPHAWVLDPIDGTKAFLIGSPLWGTLIGCTEHGRPVLGMMNQPFTRERIWSAGGPTRWQVGDGKPKPVKTRACRRLEDAMLATTSPDLLAPGAERDAFLVLKSRARLTRYGGDCYGYCLLAAGHIDVIVEAGLKPHDVVALIPIIKGAGGRITTWTGEPAHHGGRILATGDPALHARLVAELGKVG